VCVCVDATKYLNMVFISHSDFYEHSADLCGCSVIIEAVTNKNMALKHKNLFPRIRYRMSELLLRYIFFNCHKFFPNTYENKLLSMLTTKRIGTRNIEKGRYAVITATDAQFH
jgi:hypothetical protein